MTQFTHQASAKRLNTVKYLTHLKLFSPMKQVRDIFHSCPLCRCVEKAAHKPTQQQQMHCISVNQDNIWL